MSFWKRNANRYPDGPPRTESAIKREICDYLDAVGIYNRVVQVGSVGGRTNSGKGISDIIAIIPGGRWFAIEVKTQRGMLSKEQREFLDAIEAKGGIAMVARSLDDVISVLKNGIGNETSGALCGGRRCEAKKTIPAHVEISHGQARAAKSDAV